MLNLIEGFPLHAWNIYKEIHFSVRNLLCCINQIHLENIVF